MKLYNEFFDELERVLLPALFFVLASIAASAVWNFSLDFSGITQENFQQKLREIFDRDRLKIVSIWLFSFILNLYALMGLWYCLLKKGRSSASDFFTGAGKHFFSGFLPYLIINLYPGLLFLSGLFIKGSQGYRLSGAFLLMAFIFVSMWLGARISLWQGFAASGGRFLSPMLESFRVTYNKAYLLFWLLIFPYAFFANLGASVTWKFLVYSFLFFNSAVLPLAIEIVRYMIFARLTGQKIERAESDTYEMP